MSETVGPTGNDIVAASANEEPPQPPAPLRLREPRERVSPRARWIWTGEAVVTTLVVVGVLLLITKVWDWFALRGWMLPALVTIGVIYAIGMPLWRWRVHRWEATDTAVYTQRGWLSIERRIAPISRIQTVDVHRGPLSQIFGLSTVTVTTASAAGALKIEGLEASLAQRVVDDITRRTEAEQDDAT